jgi:hypothetical protein
MRTASRSRRPAFTLPSKTRRPAPIALETVSCLAAVVRGVNTGLHFGTPRRAAQVVCLRMARASVVRDLRECVAHDREVGRVDAVDEQLPHERDVRRQDLRE